jgi:hypothetical protein
MPHVFKHTSTYIIVERCFVQPLYSTDIELQGPLVDLGSRNSELGTAWSGYHTWHVGISKDMFPCVCECVFGASVRFLAEGLDFIRTAWYGDATEIGIVIALYEFNPERRQTFDVRMTICICVPSSWVAVLVRMYKRDGRRELVVVVYKVCKVDVGFTSSVLRSMQRPSVVVDRMHGVLPPVVFVNIPNPKPPRKLTSEAFRPKMYPRSSSFPSRQSDPKSLSRSL